MLLHPCADKNKTAPVCLHTGAVGWARVDCASRAVFALSSATSPQLFESTRIREFHAYTKQKAPT